MGKLNNILIVNLLTSLLAWQFSFGLPGRQIEFWGDTIQLNVKSNIQITHAYSYDEEAVKQIQEELIDAGAMEVISQIKDISARKELCDWLIYQLIRKASNQFIAKNDDYLGYTVTKWFLLKNLGYDPLLILNEDRVMLFIKSNDIVYNTPFRKINDEQYVCLNFHDYGYRSGSGSDEVVIKGLSKFTHPFTFTISKLPSLNSFQYVEKDLTFDYGNQKEHINIKLNTSVKNYFVNYPVTDYFNQFNIPFSDETRNSLVSALKEKINGMNTKQGVEYIMYFTRYAFMFEKDIEDFGRERRLSPEETLLYNKSDCEDRSALFYSLVKEIYNLPMIILSYPDHVTVAVKLDKPIGRPIVYQNELYTICEPTPQSVDLRLGEQMNSIQSQPYEIAFAYRPEKNQFKKRPPQE